MDELNLFIDNVQNIKKAVVKSTVSNEQIANGLNSFVDAQTVYTKDAVKAAMSAAGSISTELVKVNEQLWNGKAFKNLQEKVSNDLYSSFWKEAFKYYTPSYK